ncbi:MAG: hypothetical protein GC154_04870 [bacterium]|nr:hypothetical protein [bacterium]
MKRFQYLLIPLLAITWLIPVSFASAESDLARRILDDPSLDAVLKKGDALIASGFEAGEGYGEIWIRDFATFLDMAMRVQSHTLVEDKLAVFFKFQGEDGNIVDGYIPKEKASVGYKFIKSPLAPEYLAHKNTVETDQETSLIQAVYLYVNAGGPKGFVQSEIGGQAVLTRMERALNYLLEHRYAQQYGLLWGATTADWGDVQPEHEWGVEFDENTHRAIDIYDNAMFLIAIQNFIELLPEGDVRASEWTEKAKELKLNIRRNLWDKENQKFIPHIYLDGSPFPADFDENEIVYHGGTAVAALAGVLTHAEVVESLRRMDEDVKLSGAGSIGLTMYPPYPAGFFKNPSMAKPYSYQNGGDWTWFGGRMIIALIQQGLVEDAYREIQPMLKRVIDNDGFYEWYSVDNQPRGSGSYRGSAGVLGKAIIMLQKWAKDHAE